MKHTRGIPHWDFTLVQCPIIAADIVVFVHHPFGESLDFAWVSHIPTSFGNHVTYIEYAVTPREDP